MTEPVSKQIARFNRLRVNLGTVEAPNMVLVKGLSKIEMPISATEVDTTDFDSGGWDSTTTTHRNWVVNAEGFSGFTGPANAQVRDPGQAHLRAKGQLTGPDAYTHVQFYRTDTNEGFEGRVTVNWGGMGGEVKGVEPFKVELKGDGQLTSFTFTP